LAILTTLELTFQRRVPTMTIYAKILATKEHNERQLRIYVKYIAKCAVLNENLPEDTYTELHHICPRVFFPEYKNLKDHPWNGIRLTLGQHFTAHLILSNAYTFNGAMSQAFYLMCTQNGSKGQAVVDRFKNLKTYYEDARNLVINSQRGLTMVKNKETGIFGMVPVEEYTANPDLYETATTGMVTVRDIETGEIMSLSCEIYHANKDKYAAMNTGLVQVVDTFTGEKKRIPSEEYQTNKEKYTTASSGMTTVRELSTGNVIRVSVDDYENNKDKFESIYTGMTSAKEIATGKLVSIPVETYRANRDLYETATTGLLTAKNKLTGESVRLTSSEYEANKDLYQIHTAGMVTAIDLSTGENVYITSIEFQKNKHLYKSTAAGMIPVKLKLTGEARRVTTEEYNLNKQLYTRNSSGVSYIRSIHSVGTYQKPSGYVKLPHEISANQATWVHNPTTGESMKISKSEVAGEGWFGGMSHEMCKKLSKPYRNPF
jgi:hypothetical protein